MPTTCVRDERAREQRERENFLKKKKSNNTHGIYGAGKSTGPGGVIFFFFLVVTEKYDTRSRPRLPSTDKTKMRKYKKKIRRPCILLYGQVVITRVRVRIRRGDGGARGSSVSSGAAGVEGET